ncbi:MAG: hypothetical protein AAGJ37_03985 [Pseudomonadota bacterium]
MARTSLPSFLQLALKEHVMASDIHDDEEVKTIMRKLSALDEKLEQIKEQVRVNRAQRNSD